MDNILVTGGLGFIGSHIVEELVLLDHNITIIDDFSSGKLANIAHIEKKNVDVINLDIRDDDAVAAVFDRKKFDVVYHQAAIASVQKSINDAENTKAVNVHGTENIFTNAVRTHVDKVVFASSAAVYGNDPLLPKNEAMRLNPVSPYGEHKMINEDMALIYSEKGTTQFLGLRYFNVYGERQNPSSEYSGVISIFMDKFERDENLAVYGDGEQSRDFVYIKDVVTANIMMLMSYEGFCVYNVGTGVPKTINELISILEKIFSQENKVMYASPREGDIQKSVSDIGRIKRDYSYFPRYNLEQGLRRYCKNKA